MEDKKMKVLKGQIPVSILYIALGVCLALMPVETVNVLCKVCLLYTSTLPTTQTV